MKILFLTRYPVSGASSRYRVFQYLPHFEAMGLTCTVQSFMDETLYRRSHGPGDLWGKGMGTAAATLRRVIQALAARQFDLIYLQREALPLGPPLLERWLARSGVPLIFDLDDALFLHKDSRFSPLASWLRAPDKTWELFRLADCVVTGNDWLRDQARKAGARAVTIEVAEDTDRIPMRPPHRGPGTIGWLGSPSTVKYLDPLAPVLRRLQVDTPDLRFVLMGGGTGTMAGVPWERHPWSLESEVDALQRIDIGLMPLPDEPWSLGKSGGKARTYMAAGVVPVASRIGYNTELISQGETGFLCTDLPDWEATLRHLVAHPDLRQEIARRARHAIRTRFDPTLQAAKLKALFEGLVAERRADAQHGALA